MALEKRIIKLITSHPEGGIIKHHVRTKFHGHALNCCFDSQ